MVFPRFHAYIRHMQKIFPYLLMPFLLLGVLSCSDQESDSPEEPEIVPPADYELVWSDEFDGAGAINGENWFHQTRLPNGSSWFNGELQHYTNRTENSYVADGFLHIVAKKESFTDQSQTKEYTSARLNSKFAFTYGRVEINAKLPTGLGTWPALWTLGRNITENGGYWADDFGTTGWPACGEIDIMEHWGFDQERIQAALHTPSSSGNTQNKGSIVGQDVSNTFHVYAMEWTAEKIDFYYDDELYYSYAPTSKNNDTWPFTAPQYLLLNIAMGGVAGAVDPDFTESEMVIDYVRVFQK